jgi:hypothetical protein
MFAQRTDAERARERRLHANDSDEVEDEARDEPGEDADADDDVVPSNQLHFTWSPQNHVKSLIHMDGKGLMNAVLYSI